MHNKTTPRDFFIHLGATIVLYVAAISLINLVFSVIDYAVPDALAGGFYSGSIAWPISMLVVLVPLLYIFEWLIHRDYKQVPEKLQLWIRRWRIHLTLFLAGATIIGDLIALINTYLSGEITMRFVYKILAIFIICGIIFAYYLLDRMDTTTKGQMARKVLAGVGIVVVLLSIVGGFVIVGSPSKQRAQRFDQQRVYDLSSVQGWIVNQWQVKGSIPVALKELEDDISGNIIPLDPETKTPYEYTVKGKTSFELCATFSLPSVDVNGKTSPAVYQAYQVTPYAGGADTNWKHDAGRTCFSRTIDPEKYPISPKVIK